MRSDRSRFHVCGVFLWARSRIAGTWEIGALSADQRERIQSLPLARLEALAQDLLDFHTLADLTAWLNHQNG